MTAADAVRAALQALPDEVQRVIFHLVVAVDQRDRPQFERAVTFLRKEVLR